MASFRKERVGELLLAFLAQELRELSDSRLELVTLTAIKMSPDLKVATLYWSGHLPTSAKEKKDRISAINEALKGVTGLLKRKIAQNLELRYIPELRFHFDEVFETGSRIDEILAKVGQH